MKKLFASALLIMTVNAFAQPLATTTKTLNRSSGQCTLDLKYTLVTGNSPAASKINAQIQSLVSQHVQSYASILPECGAQLSHDWTIQYKTAVTYNDGNWSSWSEEGYEFTGGAHGNGSTTLLVFDSSGNRVRFADVINVSEPTVLNIIRSKVKVAMADRFEDNSFNMWSASPNALLDLNYSADDVGITVFFNSYQVASYAAGPTEIKFTWTELKPLLKANSVFREALK